MGTHPIFESDFDCLTDWDRKMFPRFKFSQFRRLTLSAVRRADQFQSKLDSHVQAAVQKGNDRPSLIYEYLVKVGMINDDTFQRSVVKKLDSLNHSLKGYHPSAQAQVPENKSVFSSFSSIFSRSKEPPKEEPLKDARVPGVYLYGNVGTGKTMLMDLFYSTTPVQKKKRVHFNRFMLGIHEQIHTLRLEAKLGHAELWDRIADQVMADTHLLCFDEFQVTDIADAMNMKTLFTALFKKGLVVIATSNRHPDNLYEHGLQRQNFVPFIPILKSQVSVINLDSGKDYRRSEVFDFNHPSWLIKTDPKVETRIQQLRDTYGRGEEEQKDLTLNVIGHELRVPSTVGAVAEFTFDDLCQEGLGVPLGAQDYLALASQYRVVIIKDVPRIDLYVMNSALRRFITLVDQMYDNGVGVLFVFDVHLDDLYFDSDHHDRELSAAERMFMDDYKIQGVAEGVKIATLSGSEESFAIERKISRLAEMSSETYWKEVKRIFDEKQL